MIKNPHVGMKVIFLNQDNPVFHQEYGKIVLPPPAFPDHPNGKHDCWWVEFTKSIVGSRVYRCSLKDLVHLNSELIEKLRREEHALKFL